MSHQQGEQRVYHLIRLVTAHGVAKVYIPEPLKWTAEMTAHLQTAESRLPADLPHIQCLHYLEKEMNDFIEAIASRNIDEPKFFNAYAVSLLNELPIALPQLSQHLLEDLESTPPPTAPSSKESSPKPRRQRKPTKANIIKMTEIGVCQTMECIIS